MLTPGVWRINPEELSLIGNEDTLFMHKYPGNMSIAEIHRNLEHGIAMVKALRGI